MKFEGAGDNKGLCGSFENGSVWVALGKRILLSYVFFFFFQSKCSKIQKEIFLKTFRLGRVEEIRNHAIAEGFY